MSRPETWSMWQRTPLWLRVTTALLVLAALGLTTTGLIGARLLRGYLVDRVDDQLVAVDEQLQRTIADLSDAPSDQTEEPLLPSDFRLLVQDRRGGRVGPEVVSRLHAEESPPDYPRLTPVAAAARDARPFTVGALRGDDAWRVLARPLPDGSGTVLVAISLRDVEDTVGNLVHIDIIVGVLVLAGLALAAYTLVRTAMRPLTEIEETAAAIAGGDLSRRIVDEDPRTEVGRLSAALNAMLNRIEAAFRAREASEARARRSEDRMRRFVADASHELRTPLTSIRGFAELHRQGAVTDADEVGGLMGRIEDEAVRMSLLVDDLLLLARLDQERPFRRQPVDLVVVAGDVVATAHARAPDRDVRLVLDLPTGDGDGGGADRGDGDDDGGERATDDGAEGTTVAGDESRLRQVVTNLVDNALLHTPEGTPVTVRVSRARRDGRPQAVLEVSDEGPGLAPDQAERVFERFYRTDTARSRAQGGTGLGLSIVAAITAAHGGTVEVDTAPGEGATFRVLLPAVTALP